MSDETSDVPQTLPTIPMSAGPFLLIQMVPEQGVSVSGGLDDRAIVYMLMGAGMDAIREYWAAQRAAAKEPRIVPVGSAASRMVDRLVGKPR